MADRGRGRGGGARGRGDSGINRGGGRGRGGIDGGPDRGRGNFRGGGGRGRGGFDGASDRGGGGFRGGARGGRGGAPIRVFENGKFPQPDPEVTKIENSLVQHTPSALAATSVEDKLPRRPGYGIKGRPVVLWANYLTLQSTKDEPEIYRYSVGFIGKDEKDLQKPKKKRLIQLLLARSPFSGIASSSDWSQIIVTVQDAKIEAKGLEFKVEWYPADGEPIPPFVNNEDERRTSLRDRSTYRILVKPIGTVSVQELKKDLSQSATTYPLKLETIQALNLFMSYGPSSESRIAVAGQNRFYPFGNHPQTETRDLGSGLQALRGYFSSVRTSVNRILVNLNVATGAFYKPGPLLDLLKEFGWPAKDKKAYTDLARFVRLLRVETNYLPDLDKKHKSTGKKKRKIHSIQNLSSFERHASNTTFVRIAPDGSSKEISVAQYFNEQYGLRLQAPQAPLVNYGTDQLPKWLPVELCSVLPGQLARRQLMGQQTREMISFAARRPADNAESIVGNGLQVTKIAPISNGLNTHLQRFGIKVSPQLITVPGRVLTPPRLQYRSSVSCAPFNGSWNLDINKLGQKPFHQVGHLSQWSALVVNTTKYSAIDGGEQGTKAHLELFRKALISYGLNPGPCPDPVHTKVDSHDLKMKNIAQLQQQIEQTLLQQFKARPVFLFVILPDDNAALYDAIKYLCDIKHGIPNICNIGRKFSKTAGQMQYFANVAMKFNQKLGGINHTVSAEEMKPLDAQTIVFGIDVTHPSPGSAETSPSIAGVVASIDAKFAQYYASIRTQAGKKEMVTELEEMILERLRFWQRKNNRLPNKVIVYRDGVSEGQFKIVLQDELPSFRKAFTTLYGAEAKHPKLSIIVVGKRHHTRFYPTALTEKDDTKTGNPTPGTVVDRGVTGEKLFDFYLLAHQGLQGTSKPGHYVVLKDENKLGADQLQVLTHNLCYTFARATRAVSICPPAYYADLLCERGRSYLHNVLKGEGAAFSAGHWHRDVHDRVKDTMFYL